MKQLASSFAIVGAMFFGGIGGLHALGFVGKGERALLLAVVGSLVLVGAPLLWNDLFLPWLTRKTKKVVPKD